MKKWCYFSIACFLILSFLLFTNVFSIAQDKAKGCINKKLCAEMIRKGKEAYMRGRYLEAKYYFKKAIQADPSSSQAWTAYDLAVIFGLAKKVEKNTSYLRSEGIQKQGETSLEKQGPPTPYPSKEKKEEGFVIEEDEGC